MKYICKGESLNDLHKIYGQGANGFYSHWWKDEAFANEKPEAGEYELKIENESDRKIFINLTYQQQKEKLPEGWDFPHPAVLAGALLEYHKTTGKYLMEDWYSRTSLLTSDGLRVGVRFFADGVFVVDYWGGARSGGLAVAAARKYKTNVDHRTLDPLESLEFRVKNLEQAVAKLEKSKAKKKK